MTEIKKILGIGNKIAIKNLILRSLLKICATDFTSCSSITGRKERAKLDIAPNWLAHKPSCRQGLLAQTRLINKQNKDDDR